ncbi:MAG: hypothetical protein B1H08_00210 [Candidatus Omnitrophica bacterium 4484_171]|nr:MAG: hypothetical protein B1H08_00210 [Candidatus Omnitrophica bacterium 4484_171]
MKKSKLSFFRIKITALAGCAVITVIYGILVSLPVFKCKKYQNRISAGQYETMRLRNDENNYRDFIIKYRTQKKELEGILFNDRDVSSFLEEISLIARKSHIKISEMKTRKFKKVEPKNSTSGNSYSGNKPSGNKEDKPLFLAAMPIDIRIEGRFSSIVNFLVFLEGYRQLITLSNVEIRIKKYPLLRCKFTLRLYSLKSGSELKDRR